MLCLVLCVLQEKRVDDLQALSVIATTTAVDALEWLTGAEICASATAKRCSRIVGALARA